MRRSRPVAVFYGSMDAKKTIRASLGRTLGQAVFMFLITLIIFILMFELFHRLDPNGERIMALELSISISIGSAIFIFIVPFLALVMQAFMRSNISRTIEVQVYTNHFQVVFRRFNERVYGSFSNKDVVNIEPFTPMMKWQEYISVIPPMYFFKWLRHDRMLKESPHGTYFYTYAYGDPLCKVSFKEDITDDDIYGKVKTFNTILVDVNDIVGFRRVIKKTQRTKCSSSESNFSSPVIQKSGEHQ